MGEVWLARHQLLARPAAVKLIRQTTVADSGDTRALRQRFEREAHATAELQSPHTVQLYDFGMTESGSFYYVMERLRGMDLQRMVERHGPLPPERAIYLLKQACLSLSEAHGLGLVHRDVKPANLFACRLGPSTTSSRCWISEWCHGPRWSRWLGSPKPAWLLELRHFLRPNWLPAIERSMDEATSTPSAAWRSGCSLAGCRSRVKTLACSSCITPERRRLRPRCSLKNRFPPSWMRSSSRVFRKNRPHGQPRLTFFGNDLTGFRRPGSGTSGARGPGGGSTNLISSPGLINRQLPSRIGLGL